MHLAYIIPEQCDLRDQVPKSLKRIRHCCHTLRKAHKYCWCSSYGVWVFNFMSRRYVPSPAEARNVVVMCWSNGRLFESASYFTCNQRSLEVPRNSLEPKARVHQAGTSGCGHGMGRGSFTHDLFNWLLIITKPSRSCDGYAVIRTHFVLLCIPTKRHSREDL